MTHKVIVHCGVIGDRVETFQYRLKALKFARRMADLHDGSIIRSDGTIIVDCVEFYDSGKTVSKVYSSQRRTI